LKSHIEKRCTYEPQSAQEIIGSGLSLLAAIVAKEAVKDLHTRMHRVHDCPTTSGDGYAFQTFSGGSKQDDR
jgi:hypothetical protein